MKKTLMLSNFANNPEYARREIYDYYFRKYFNLFMTLKVKGVDYQAENFIKRRLWARGTIAVFKLEGSEGSEEYPNGMPIFVDYAPINYNIYDYPIQCTLINRRGVKFIPSKLMDVDKNVVIGFAQNNHLPIVSMVDIYIQKITDVEMTIRTNLKAHKTPVIFAINPENEEKMRVIKNNFESDDPALMMELEDMKAMQVFNGNTNYVIDKLYAYKMALENELKEYLGINNLGVNEKKEHLINSEVEANNEVISNSVDCFMDELEKFSQNIKDVLGIDVSFEWDKPELEEYNQQEDEESEETEDVM